MAFTAADGSKWSNAAQARKVPGRKQGDGKQPVSSFSKPEAPRAPTASPLASAHGQENQSAGDSTQAPEAAPTVEVTQEGNMFVVTAKFASAEEAHAAAQSLQGQDDQSAAPANPAQAMM